MHIKENLIFRIKRLVKLKWIWYNLKIGDNIVKNFVPEDVIDLINQHKKVFNVSMDS